MNQFPNTFTWGTATSAYQIEGGWNLNGKGPSIWDAFCQIPGKIAKNETGQVACNHLEHFKEDILLMKQMGLDAYRFSISWPRIQPKGYGKKNKAGIQFYSELIDCLLEHDIEPWVTLYHWDLPLALQLEKDGWIGDEISDYFTQYADICFEHFGDRVKHWITINEPWVVAMLGYGQGVFAPGRSSNSEPYKAGHELIKAHAKTVQLYRTKYQKEQGGIIGISNNCDWREPLTNSPEDRASAQRALEFFLGWFADPIYLGDYPEIMKKKVGDRLPSFSEEEKSMIKGSSDFFGLNHYTTMYAADASSKQVKTSVYGNGGLSEDQQVSLSTDPSWKQTSMNWSIVPWGCRKLLEWIDQRYGHPEIIITENGCAFDDQIIDGHIQDNQRQEFYQSYLEESLKAINNGVKLKGYFAWSFMDNFEWASGYEKRFGLHYVDFETLERTPKLSALWFRDFLSGQKK